MLPFDFDEMVKLAKEDPAAFEAARKDILEDAALEIADPEARHRALAACWAFEQKLRKLAGPERFNQAVAMFFEQLHKFQDALNK